MSFNANFNVDGGDVTTWVALVLVALRTRPRRDSEKRTLRVQGRVRFGTDDHPHERRQVGGRVDRELLDEGERVATRELPRPE